MTKFDTYSGLFAEKGGFDIPQTFTGGVAVKPADKLTVALDVQWINYESVKSVGNDFLPNLASRSSRDDERRRLRLARHDGLQGGPAVRGGRDWVLRTGYSYGRQPIRSNEVLINILAPGVMEHHVTAGITRAIKKGQAINFAIIRAIPKSVSGPNNLEAPNRQSIELKMDQWEYDVSYSFGF